MPVAIISGVTEIECPKAMLATALTLSLAGSRGWADSTSSLGAFLYRPKACQYLPMLAAPDCRAMRAAPMLEEWVNTSHRGRFTSPLS